METPHDKSVHVRMARSELLFVVTMVPLGSAPPVAYAWVAVPVPWSVVSLDGSPRRQRRWSREPAEVVWAGGTALRRLCWGMQQGRRERSGWWVAAHKRTPVPLLLG